MSLSPASMSEESLGSLGPGGAGGEDEEAGEEEEDGGGEDEAAGEEEEDGTVGHSSLSCLSFGSDSPVFKRWPPCSIMLFKSSGPKRS